MMISALFIIGGLLVVILGLSGDMGNETTGIITGTVLFIIGLIFLRRQRAMLNTSVTSASSTSEASAPVVSTAPEPDIAEPVEEDPETPEPESVEEGILVEADDEQEEDDEQAEEPEMADAIPETEASADKREESQEGNFVKVATTDDVKAGVCTAVEVEGIPVALFNLDGEFYALRDNCSHARARLSAGEFEGNEVVCPLHGATFNIKSGEATGPPAYNGVKTYRVRVTGSDIEIEV